MNRSVPLAQLLLIAAGVTLILIAGLQAIHVTRQLARGVKTDGVIERAEAHPVISFETSTREKYRFAQNGFVSAPQGAHVPVLYQANDPAASAFVATFWPLWWVVVWTLLPGIGLIGLGIADAAPVLRGRWS